MKKGGKRTVLPQSAIFGVIFEVVILELGIPARLGELQRLRHETRPVLDGGGEVAGVHNVKLLLERPRFLAVVDFEFDVGWDPRIFVGSDAALRMEKESPGGKFWG